MELHAAGFNGLNMCSFLPWNATDTESTDIPLFTRVLTGSAISLPRPRLCYATVRTEKGARVGGLPDRSRNLETEANREHDLRCIEAGNGRVVVLEPTTRGDEAQGHTIIQYATYMNSQTQQSPTEHREVRGATQVVAYEAGFAALSRDGRVWTWGDSRYPDCLGRVAASERSRATPGVVDDLDGWPVGPIRKIAAGGYTLAAINQNGDLYCWGSTPKPFQILPDLCETPNLVEVDGGKDVIDVAVGQAHMLVLTRDGDLYGIGSNSNGQLGLKQNPGDQGQELDGWMKLDICISEGYSITGIAAGPMNSFVLSEARRNEEP